MLIVLDSNMVNLTQGPGLLGCGGLFNDGLEIGNAIDGQVVTDTNCSVRYQQLRRPAVHSSRFVSSSRGGETQTYTPLEVLAIRYVV